MAKSETNNYGYKLPNEALSKFMSNPNRHKIISALINSNEPLTLAELTKRFDITKEAIYRHLKDLRMSGFIYRTKSDNETYYHVNWKRLGEELDAFNEIFTEWQKRVVKMKEQG